MELPLSNPFFDHPILNSPYECPQRHWELDPEGQPTQQIQPTRRRAEFITPIPKPKKRKKAAQQNEMVFDEGKDLSTAAQQYDPTSIINQVRQNVDTWRALPNPSQWQVTPETARLLQHWRHHKFSGAVEKKSTMDTYWVPGVNHLGSYGRWAFAEFTEVFQIQAEFKATIDANFNQLIEGLPL
jgi:type III restriction enzyme